MGELTCGSYASVKTLVAEHISIKELFRSWHTHEKEGANSGKQGHAQSIRSCTPHV